MADKQTGLDTPVQTGYGGGEKQRKETNKLSAPPSEWVAVAENNCEMNSEIISRSFFLLLLPLLLTLSTLPLALPASKSPHCHSVTKSVNPHLFFIITKQNLSLFSSLSSSVFYNLKAIYRSPFLSLSCSHIFFSPYSFLIIAKPSL